MSCKRCLWLLAVLLLVGAGSVRADDAATDPAKADVDYGLQGEYLGKFSLGDGNDQQFGMQLIALGDGKFHVVAYIGGLPGEGWDGFTKLEADAESKDGIVEITANEGSAQLKDGVVTVQTNDGTELGRLEKTTRKSETEGAAPAEGAVVLFDGKNVDAWEGAELGPDNVLVVKSLKGALSKQKFKNFTAHLEFRTPFMPKAKGQARGNSGVYLLNRYEVQVLDSFGLEGLEDECGGIYSIKAPDTNMCFPPLAWQTYDIEFTAPAYGEVEETNDKGEKSKVVKKTTNAKLTVKQNGVLIHDNIDLPNVTPGGDEEADSAGPLLLQHHGNPVVYRNIWVVEKK